MTKLLQPAYNDKDDNNYDTKAIATPHVFSENRHAKKACSQVSGRSPHRLTWFEMFCFQVITCTSKDI